MSSYNIHIIIQISVGREAREDARVVRVSPPSDAAGGRAAETARGGVWPGHRRAARYTAAGRRLRH